MKLKLSYLPLVAQLLKQYLIYWLCFFIPLNKIVSSYLIGFIFLFWLLEGRFKERFTLLFNEKKRIFIFSLSAFYFLYLLGLIITKNFTYAGFDLQVKLSIFIFPLVFSTIDLKHYTNDIILSLLKIFIYGLLLNSIICLVFALYKYFFEIHHFDYFLYAKLSGTLGFHPTYLAMYLNFAVMIILTLLISDVYTIKKKLKKWFIILIIYFSFFIILLSSKAGIISLALCFFIFLVYLIMIKKKRIKFVIVRFFLLILSSIVVFILVPSALNRLNVAFEVVSQNRGNIKETGESTSDRIMIWKASTEIIKSNFFTGVGTGDVKDVLLEKYKERKLMHSYDQKLNSHNQFLQTFISIGIIGFLTLLSSLIIPFIIAIRRNNLIHVFFLIIFFINILVESMLENQAGVVYYAFFATFLLMFSFKKTIND